MVKSFSKNVAQLWDSCATMEEDRPFSMSSGPESLRNYGRTRASRLRNYGSWPSSQRRCEGAVESSRPTKTDSKTVEYRIFTTDDADGHG